MVKHLKRKKMHKSLLTIHKQLWKSNALKRKKKYDERLKENIEDAQIVEDNMGETS